MVKLLGWAYLFCVLMFGGTYVFAAENYVLEVGRQQDGYFAFPSIFHIKNADSSIGFKVTGRGRATHFDHSGISINLRSNNCGETWSEVTDLRSPSLVENDLNLQDAAANGWVKLNENEEAPLAAMIWRDGPNSFFAQGAKSLSSTDGGKTWQSQVIKLRKHVVAMNYNRAAKIITSKGTAIVAIYIRETEKSRNRVVYLRKTSISNDWNPVYPIMNSNQSNLGFDETALVELPDQRLLAIMRPEPDSSNQLYFSTSNDDGVSWTEPMLSGIKGYPATAVIVDGQLIILVGLRRQKPMSIDSYLLNAADLSVIERKRLATSTNENLSNFGYPVALVCKNRLVYTFYTSDDKMSVYSEIHSRPLSFFMKTGVSQ